MKPLFPNNCTYENDRPYKQREFDHHFIDYVANGSDILFITFDGLFPKDVINVKTRYPWGGKHLLNKGVDLLGIKTNRSNWYRDKYLYNFFLSDDFQELLKKYKRVIFYGESMGAYAALAFSSIHKGSEILCYAPQTTLDKKITPWDDRYTKYGQKANWTGPFKDASKELKHAKSVHIVYDPFDKYDPKHIARLPQNKITKLKAPFLDHEVSAYISGFDLMKPAIQHFLDGTLQDWWPKAIRIRKTANVYKSNAHYYLALRYDKRNQLDAAIEHCEKSLKENMKNKKALEFARTLIHKKKNPFA